MEDLLTDIETSRKVLDEAVGAFQYTVLQEAEHLKRELAPLLPSYFSKHSLRVQVES